MFLFQVLGNFEALTFKLLTCMYPCLGSLPPFPALSLHHFLTLSIHLPCPHLSLSPPLCSTLVSSTSPLSIPVFHPYVCIHTPASLSPTFMYSVSCNPLFHSHSVTLLSCRRRSQATCCLHPIVFIVSDSTRSESSATQLFPQHLTSELRISHIR